jgi:tetratricopeptide (TPR) repeat protein
MSSEISPQFIASLTNALTYWQQQTQDLDDAGIIEIDPERHNLHEVVTIGLDLPQTWELAAGVILQAFPLAERRGYWQEWLEVLNKALAHCPDTAYRLQGQLLNRMGELYRYNRQLEKAITAHKQAETIAQERKNESSLAEAHYCLCWDYLETKQYAVAEQCGLAALEVFTHLAVTGVWLSNIYRALGMVARMQGNLAIALERLTRSADSERKLLEPTRLARILQELAQAFQDAERYDEALVCYTEASEILEPTASERDKMLVQINLGVLFFRQHRWGRAEICFRQANDSLYLRQSGEIFLQALVANNLGNVLLKQEHLAEAETHLRQAWQLWLEIQDNLSLANTIGSLAELYAKQDKVVEAKSLFRQAIQLLAAYPDDAFAQKRLLPQFQKQLQGLIS